MHPKKLEYAKEILKLATQMCAVMTTEQSSPIAQVLNLSPDDLFEIIKKIMIALPDEFFYNATPAMLNNLIAFISNQLILFQVQEDISEEHYPYHLSNFINELAYSIASLYEAKAR